MRNVIGVALAFLVACGESDSTKPKPDLPPGSVLVGEVTIPPHGMPEEPTVPTKKYLLDATLRLNEIQLKGSHNSYHLWVDNGEPEWAYDVPPLAVQLEYQGVRAFELDVHYMYGRFGVYQVPGWESRSTCPWLEECLAQILTWSNANPGHVPLIVYFETRDTGSDVFYEHVAEFEQAIVAAIPRAKMYTPDDLLGTTYQDVTSALQVRCAAKSSSSSTTLAPRATATCATAGCAGSACS
jgi:hypothetical protein